MIINEQQLEVLTTALRVAKSHSALMDAADTLRAGVKDGLHSPLTQLLENAIAVVEEVGEIPALVIPE